MWRHLRRTLRRILGGSTVPTNTNTTEQAKVINGLKVRLRGTTLRRMLTARLAQLNGSSDPASKEQAKSVAFWAKYIGGHRKPKVYVLDAVTVEELGLQYVS
jgi:hypothetical protein